MSVDQTTTESPAPLLPPAALSPEDAAIYLGRPGAAKTLSNWRSLGKGPRWVSIMGRPAYRVADLDAYLAAGGDPR